MVDNSWAYNLPTQIYSLVKSKTEKKIKNKFPKVRFTTSDRASGTPVYPTVYIFSLPNSEMNRDTVGDAITTVNFGMQIEVIIDTSQNDASTIMAILMEAFKEMKFTVSTFPNFQNGATYYRLVSRCTRKISGGDSF